MYARIKLNTLQQTLSHNDGFMQGLDGLGSILKIPLNPSQPLRTPQRPDDILPLQLLSSNPTAPCFCCPGGGSDRRAKTLVALSTLLLLALVSPEVQLGAPR